MRLTEFKALTFDCYGTLIDWEAGIAAGLSKLAARLPEPLSRDRILEAHARHESHQQVLTPDMPYNRLLQVVYKRLAEEWGLAYTWEEALAYGQSVGDWPAFPDSASTLQYLKKYFKLVIVSNVDNESFEVSNRKLDVEFDAIVTAEDVGSYKPSRRNFEYLFDVLSSLGVKKEESLHIADSNYHDLQPAAEVGLRSCWIYRRFEQRGFGATVKTLTEPSVDFKFTSMAQLVKAHHDELANG
ncbi:haloacid dehalogenase type II [Caballeronia ptereochthonis]|uniref:Haloacid dehalogenase n=1 Tax=Caballeronia ptereochthonis TaxID=1777144 RepID=A0A158E2E8_9BURK|nr:haloacid dehalogenase type II [Caballeronia ptereochthonis]SAL00616.1 haloacid dehalogenase [Caballeronia ptereochthonis]